MNISYSQEEQPLGTAGPLSLIDGLEDTFLVSNGDVLCNMDLSDLLNYHAKSNAVATISSYSRKINIDLGVMQLGDNGDQVVDYIEKPDYTFQVSMGIYVFEPLVITINFIFSLMGLSILLISVRPRKNSLSPLRLFILNILCRSGRRKSASISNTLFPP